MRTIPLVVIGGFLLGVFFRSLYTVDIYILTALILGAVSILFMAHVRTGVRTLHHRTIFMIALVILGVVAGAVRTEFAYQSFADMQTYENGTHIETEATIVAEPDIRDTHIVLVLEIDTMYESETSVRVRARVPQFPVLVYGERVKVQGVLELPSSFITDTGRVFNYPGYLMKDGIHYELAHAEITSLGTYGGSIVVGHLLSIKQAWLNSVSQIIPEPGASLMGGVVVGAKRSLGEEWLTKFRDTGIIHIVVLSGYNLTLVAVFIVWLTGWLPKFGRFTFGVLGVIGFALMTGASATIVRASVMAILAMLATFINRPYLIMRSLVIAAWLMVLYNPFLLVFDPGFQLSFIATVGLVLGAPLLEPKLTLIPKAFGLRLIVAATLATQAAVLPLLLYQIGSISLVAPIVNVLILPIVPFVMGIGFVAGAVATVSITLALPFGWIAYAALSYMFWIVDLFASFSFSQISLPPVSFFVVVCMYALLFLLVRTKHNTTE